MEWLLNMPGNGRDILDAQVTVKAENWFAALRAGLKRIGVAPLSNVSCAPGQGGALEVKDFVSGRVFHIQPVSTDAENASPGATIELFGGRDITADEGGVSYCERRICVPAQLSVAQAEAIGKDVLRVHIKPTKDRQLVVAVQVYDHRFDEHPRRPAIVRMAWQQWRPEVLKVDYPASGRMSESPGEADFFQQADAPLDTARKIDAFDVSKLCVLPKKNGATQTSAESTIPSKKNGQALANSEIVRPTPTPESKPKPKVVDTARLERKREATQKVIDGVDDGVMWAFEQMQHLYDLKEHDSAASMVCKTLMTAIPSEAGAILLSTPGKSQLYVAAQHGFDQTAVADVRVPMLGGIVGAALKSGAVLNVSDPGDERFDARVDLQGPFDIDTVLVSPIAFEGHVFGVALLFNRLDDALFTQDDANVLSYVSGAFAEFIQVSLPSREAEFQNKEFEGMLIPQAVLGAPTKKIKKKPRLSLVEKLLMKKKGTVTKKTKAKAKTKTKTKTKAPQSAPAKKTDGKKKTTKKKRPAEKT